MTKQAIFAGLVVDENDRPVEASYVGDEPVYIVDDAGFRRHIPSEQVDRQVMQAMGDMIKGAEEQISEQAAKMLGQDDIFSIALITNQLKHIDQHFDALLETGIPEETRAYLGMIGFKIHINVHGEVLDIEQPGTVDPDSE